jgi:hypothetical protein
MTAIVDLNDSDDQTVSMMTDCFNLDDFDDHEILTHDYRNLDGYVQV